MPTAQPRRDSDLLEGVAAGDRQALAGLLARYAASLYTLALGILRESTEADEVVGSVFRDVQQEARRFSPNHYPVSRWLSDITRRTAVEHLRTRTSPPAGSSEATAVPRSIA